MSTKLVQRHGLFRKRVYEIAENELVIENSTFTAGDTARYEIFDLSERTERYFRRDLRWIVGAVVVALFGSIFAWDAIKLGATFPLIATGLCLALAAGMGAMYVERSYDQVIFTHHQTGNRIFILWNNKPNKAEFQRFYDALIDKIRALRVNPKATPQQKLDLYARQLFFLVQEEVLTPDEAKVAYERKEKAFAKERANVISIVPGRG